MKKTKNNFLIGICVFFGVVLLIASIAGVSYAVLYSKAEREAKAEVIGLLKEKYGEENEYTVTDMSYGVVRGGVGMAANRFAGAVFLNFKNDEYDIDFRVDYSDGLYSDNLLSAIGLYNFQRNSEREFVGRELSELKKFCDGVSSVELNYFKPNTDDDFLPLQHTVSAVTLPSAADKGTAVISSVNVRLDGLEPTEEINGEDNAKAYLLSITDDVKPVYDYAVKNYKDFDFNIHTGDGYARFRKDGADVAYSKEEKDKGASHLLWYDDFPNGYWG